MNDICDKCGGSMRMVHGKYLCRGIYTETLLICNKCSRVIIGNDSIGIYRVKMAKDTNDKYSGDKIVNEIFKGLDEDI